MFVKFIKILVLPILCNKKSIKYFKAYDARYYYPTKKVLFYSSYNVYRRRKSYDHFKKYFKSSIFLEERKIREYSILKALENNKDNLFLEFGVFQGKSINFFAKKNRS